MSEPTYRVEVSHDPSEIEGLQWSARVYRLTDEGQSLPTQWGGTMEDAFDRAQALVRRVAQGPTAGVTVYLSEDGDLLDRHDPRNLSEKMYGRPS